jgi:hypothetical protein
MFGHGSFIVFGPKRAIQESSPDSQTVRFMIARYSHHEFLKNRTAYCDSRDKVGTGISSAAGAARSLQPGLSSRDRENEHIFAYLAWNDKAVSLH